VSFLAQEVSPHTYLNIMAQYHPAHRACAFPQLARPVLKQEFLQAIDSARQHGLERLDGLRSPSAVGLR
jgi:putative pyruvate formate lyase activating enzyme